MTQEFEKGVQVSQENLKSETAKNWFKKLGGGLNPLMNDRHIPKHLNSRQFHARPMLRQRV